MQMWIKPAAIRSQLNHLKKLFIANVPMNWDTFWILHLLAAAPALESLHVHVRSSYDFVKHCTFFCFWVIPETLKSEFEQKQCTPAVRRNDLGMWKNFLELGLGEVTS